MVKILPDLHFFKHYYTPYVIKRTNPIKKITISFPCVQTSLILIHSGFSCITMYNNVEVL